MTGYYTSKGLTFGTISHFDGMETGEVIAHVIEGRGGRPPYPPLSLRSLSTLDPPPQGAQVKLAK